MTHSQGTSGGGLLAVALEFAQGAKRGSSIVVLLPDTGVLQCVAVCCSVLQCVAV